MPIMSTSEEEQNINICKSRKHYAVNVTLTSYKLDYMMYKYKSLYNDWWLMQRDWLQ